MEVCARLASLVEVGQRVAEAGAGEGFAADRAGLAAQCGGFEQVRSRGLEIACQ